MREFRDDQGRPWQVALTTAAAMRVRDNVTRKVDGEDKPFDLVDFNAIGDTLDVLRGGYVTIAETLYWVLINQINQKGISKDDFFDGLRGDCMDEAAKVLEEELVDFFPSRLRSVVSAVAAKGHEATDVQLKVMAEKVQSLDPTKLLEQSGMPSGNVPASSASTPETGPFDNLSKPETPASKPTGGTRRTSSAKCTT